MLRGCMGCAFTENAFRMLKTCGKMLKTVFRQPKSIPLFGNVITDCEKMGGTE